MAVKVCDYYVSISILGDHGVGKTEISNRFRYGDSYAPNVIDDSGSQWFKTVCMYEKAVKLTIQDSVDNSRYSTNFEYYINRRNEAYMIVFDITDSKTFSSINYWLDKINRIAYDHDPIIILVGNKCDLDEERAVTFKQATEFANWNGMEQYTETSAQTGHNINGAFEFLVKTVLNYKHTVTADTAIKDNPNKLKETREKEKDNSNKTKEKKEKEKVLKKNLNKAKKENGTVPVRFLKLFFTGSGAAGKTSFINLLLKRQFNKFHHSTNVVHTSHAVSVKKAVLHGSYSEITWTDFDSELEIKHLHSILLPKPSILPEPPLSPEPQASQLSAVKVVTPSKSTTSVIQYKPFKPQQSTVKYFFAGLFKTSVKDFNLSTFDSIIDATAPNPVSFQPGVVLNIITLLDTGGQPEYIHLLPTINIYPTVTFVIHDLSKSLSDQVLVEYSQHGKHMFTPYHLSYSNLDMIKLLMSAANDAVEKPTTSIPQLVTTPSSNKKSYVCLVGTHADKVRREVKVEVERELATWVNRLNCETAVWQDDKGEVLFSVDNTTAGRQHLEDPVANVIRNRIEFLAQEKDIYEFPITWMLLELEIRHVCSKRQQAYISFQECVAIARETGLMSKVEEIKSVLLYHHLLGVLIHFEDVPGLRDYVIVDHQWWFDKLSNIISITFLKASDDHHAVQKLKYQGLLTEEVLQHVEWKDDIKEEFFLTLLVHMRIIAPIFTEKELKEYFIPFILPTCNLKQSSKLLHRYGHLQGQPLVVHFQSGLLPRGMFCSLIVELLQHSPKGWHSHFSHEGVHHTFSNLITFRVHDGYSLSLLDQVSYLEVQIRHLEEEFSIPIHNGVYNYLVYALTEVCIHLNFDYERLQYGFVCQCGKGIGNHIAVVSNISSSMRYAECSLDSLQLVKLDSSHLVWFSLVETSSFDNGAYGSIIQKLKDNYNDLIILNATIMLPSLYAKDVITLVDKDTISLTKPLERDKMQYLLDQIIIPSLQAGVLQKFKLFLEVMEESEDTVTRTMARQLAIDQPRSLNLSGDQALIHSLIEDNPEAIDHPKLSKTSSDVVIVHSSTRDNTNQPAFKGLCETSGDQADTDSLVENNSDQLQPTFKRPAMRLLHDIVVPRIADDWSIVADYLEYEVEYKRGIKEKCCDDPVKCCVELLEDWLSSNRGVSPKSWSRLIEALRGIRSLTATVEEIVQDLAKLGIATTQ